MAIVKDILIEIATAEDPDVFIPTISYTDILTEHPTSIDTFEDKRIFLTEILIVGDIYRINFKLLTQLNGGDRSYFTLGADTIGVGGSDEKFWNDKETFVGTLYTETITPTKANTRLQLYCTNYGGNIEFSFEKVIAGESGMSAKFDSLIVPLENKKVVLFGTSIPAGINTSVIINGYTGQNKYPSMVGFLTGATVYNEAIGGTRISTGWASEYNATTNPLGLKDQQDSSYQFYSSLGHTIAEKDYIYDNWASIRSKFNDNGGLSDTPPISKEAMRDYSFERKLIKKYLTPTATVGRGNLYILDHSFNDFAKLLVTDGMLMPVFGDPTERMTYWGAMNYFIRKIYADNPRHRIVMISHYRNNGEQYIKNIYDVQKEIVKFWGIPFIDTAEKLQIGAQFITTNGYWDVDQIWHESGYTFVDNGDSTYTTNDNGIPDFWQPYATYLSVFQPHQVVAETDEAISYPVGTWVRKTHQQLTFCFDNLHPHSDLSGKSNFDIARIISNELVRYI